VVAAGFDLASALSAHADGRLEKLDQIDRLHERIDTRARS
jgi:hypothetical protein